MKRVTNGKRIEKARVKAGCSIADLAKETGISASTLYRIERDEITAMHWPTLRKICAALSLNPMSLD